MFIYLLFATLATIIGLTLIGQILSSAFGKKSKD